MTQKDIYEFYNEKVKILYSDVEARNNTLPVELLFEIVAAFDHLKRIYVNNETEEQCSLKAYSHLKRGMLDAFKLKLKYHNDTYISLTSSKNDLRLIDNGTFFKELLSCRTQIISNAKNARLNEGLTDLDESIEDWSRVSILIDDFETKFLVEEKLQWAKKHSYFRFSKDFIVGLISGIIGSIIVALIF